MARTEGLWEIKNGSLVPAEGTEEDIRLPGPNAYINFGTTTGSPGYGIRDNGGNLQFKDSGGSWSDFGSGAATELADLSDVDSSVGSPSDGDIMVFRNAGGDWVLESKPAGGSNPSMADITDVTINSVGDDDIIAYDSGAGEYINQTASEAGLAAASHTHAAGDITSGTFADARISESSVTQHEGSITITESQISDLNHTTDTQLSNEEVQDAVYNNVLSGTQTLINVTYDDANNEVDYVVDNDLSNYDNSTSGFLTSEVNDLTSSVTWANVPDSNITQSSVTQHEGSLTITESQISDLNHTTDTQLSNEEVQDIAGGMVTGNTETLISVTYQDGDGTIDFVVDNDLSNYDNSTSGFLTSEVNDLTSNVTWADVPDSNITQSSVTQHEGSLTITESQISDLNHFGGAYTDLSGSPSDVITAGTNLSWSGSTLNGTGGGSTNNKVYTGSFVVSSTGDINITGLPFDPNTVEFRASLPVDAESLAGKKGDNSDDDTGFAGNMFGFARQSDGTQKAMSTGGSGNSINNVRYGASNSKAIYATYGDQNANEVARLEGTVSSWNTGGFTVNIDTYSSFSSGMAGQVVHYTAYRTEDISGVATDVSDGGSLVVSDAGDINFGANLSVTDDTDGTVTVDATGTNTQLSNEEVQDAVYNNVLSGTQTLINVTYDDANNEVDYVVDDDLSNYDNSTSGFLTSEANDLTSSVTWANVPDSNITQSSVTQHEGSLTITESQISDLNHLTLEEVQDDFGNNVLVGGTNTTINYDDAANTITIKSTDNDTQLSDEEVQDAVYNNVLSGTQTLINVTYDDANNEVDFVVDNDLSNYDNSTSGFVSSPAGSDTQIQYNNSGSFGASSGFVWDSANASLGVGESSPAANLHVHNTQDSGAVEIARFQGDRANPNIDNIDEQYMSFYMDNAGNTATEAAQIRMGYEPSGTSKDNSYISIQGLSGGTGPFEFVRFTSFGYSVDNGTTIISDHVTESDGIGSNDDDSSVPTSAAVKDYVDNSAHQFSFTIPTDQWAAGLSNAEIGRKVLQSGETLVIDRIELHEDGGGASNANMSVRVQDVTAATTVGSTDLNTVTKSPGSSGTANTIAIQITNTTGSQVNASVEVTGRVTGV